MSEGKKHKKSKKIKDTVTENQSHIPEVAASPTRVNDDDEPSILRWCLAFS